MTPLRVAGRRVPSTFRPPRLTPHTTTLRQTIRFASSQGGSGRNRGGLTTFLGGFALAFGVAGAALLAYSPSKQSGKPEPAEIVFEKSRPKPKSKESNRAIISSQHVQVQKSWENPGLYAWGSNSGRVVAPDSTEAFVKSPRRIAYFDGQLLRDVKLDREFGAAILENGDLVQWGAAFSPTTRQPVKTLRGRDLVKLTISRDRVLALGKNGTVYSIPVSSTDQALSAKEESSSWLGLWSTPSTASYRNLNVPSLAWGEKVTDITSGMEHALLLTNKGRVFSSASSTHDFPSKGQLGIPGLTWAAKPSGPYDQPHEIVGLKGFHITKVAAGDYHSLALDQTGHVFVFGDNQSGQLGFETELEIPFVATPIPLPFEKIYSGSKQKPFVTNVAAGGENSFFTVDATRISNQTPAAKPEDARLPRNLGKVTADTWACGSGIYGSLGTGKWTHVSLGPSKIKPLSGLFEWDEKAHVAIPIRLAAISVGSNHVAAVMDNVTQVDAHNMSSENDVNWGADIVFWGGNGYYQLGTGKKNNAATPTYIAPLDGGAGDVENGRADEEHRFQITPRSNVRLGPGGKGRKVSMQQKVECGRYVSAVYAAT